MSHISLFSDAVQLTWHTTFFSTPTTLHFQHAKHFSEIITPYEYFATFDGLPENQKKRKMNDGTQVRHFHCNLFKSDSSIFANFLAFACAKDSLFTVLVIVVAIMANCSQRADGDGDEARPPRRHILRTRPHKLMATATTASRSVQKKPPYLRRDAFVCAEGPFSATSKYHVWLVLVGCQRGIRSPSSSLSPGQSPLSWRRRWQDVQKLCNISTSSGKPYLLYEWWNWNPDKLFIQIIMDLLVCICNLIFYSDWNGPSSFR